MPTPNKMKRIAAAREQKEAAKGEDKTSKDALIIAIDFGTTFSGVAWRYTASNRSRHIRKWPNNSQNADKVPTALAYNERQGGPRWGFNIPSTVTKRLEWFKLLLNEPFFSPTDLLDRLEGYGLKGYYGNDTDLSQLRETIKSIPPGKEPVDLVTDYLKGIYEHTLTTLGNAYPHVKEKLDENQLPIKVYLTVPAIWDDKAKELTHTAATNAGMNHENIVIEMISEPEAAAVYCLTDLQDEENSVKVGDVYVIADCGGGTVDLTSYEVTSIKPRLKVKECTIGTGGLCGSTVLNRRFEAMIIEEIGQEAYDSMEDHHRQAMRKDFDSELKPKFIPPDETAEDFEDEPHICELPGVADIPKRVRRGRIRFSTEEMKKLFEPTFGEITSLIQKQVTLAEKNTGKDITGVFLVGGFASSPYLLDWLRSKVHDKEGKQVKIINPDSPAACIVLGALKHGVSMHEAGVTSASSPCDGSMVYSRKARCSYGVTVIKPFIWGEHPRAKLAIDPYLGMPICLDQMEWIVQKGADMVERKPIRIDFHRRYPAFEKEIPKDQLIYKEEIYCCFADNAPEDVEHKDVCKLLTYEVDLNDVPLRLFKKRKGTRGVDFWALSASILMKFRSAQLEFKTQVLGQPYGAGKVDYDHT